MGSLAVFRKRIQHYKEQEMKKLAVIEKRIKDRMGDNEDTQVDPEDTQVDAEDTQMNPMSDTQADPDDL